MGRIAGIRDYPLEVLEAGNGGNVLDGGFFGGEVYGCGDYAIESPNCFFNSTDAGCTGHVAYRDIEFARGDSISFILDRSDDDRQADRDIRL